MGKVIAVYGSPGSGTTSISFKIAVDMYMNSHSKEKVMFLSPDILIPSIGLLFPNYDSEKIASLSNLLDSPDISEDLILKNTVVIKSMRDFCCLGFKTGDNILSFPAPTDNKINSLYKKSKEIFDLVIVDCSDDSISDKAIKESDALVRIIAPDIKGMNWIKSDIRNKIEKTSIDVLNITDKRMYLPVYEVKAEIGSVSDVIPYSQCLRQQFSDGELYLRTKDRLFNKKIRQITKEIGGIINVQ